MSWTEIKNTPRYELVSLLGAMSNYNKLHAFDGYTPNEIGDMAKDKPALRSQYNESKGLEAKYQLRSGKERNVATFKEIMG